MPKVSRTNYRRAQTYTNSLLSHISDEVFAISISNSHANISTVNLTTDQPNSECDTSDLDTDILTNPTQSNICNVSDNPINEGSNNFHFDTFSQLPVPSLQNLLAGWALKNNITHTAINELLVILNPLRNELPKDARTLVHTPRKICTKIVEPGHYYHFGLEKCIVNLLQQCDFSKLDCTEFIELLINVDGLPISENPPRETYPILCCLVINPKIVDMVGIYYGFTKPNDSNKFLEDFVIETVGLTERGFKFKDKLYFIRIKGFVCDVPARAFILKTKGHSGYYSCYECDIKGTYHNGRTCFPSKTFNLRSDEDFRRKKQEEHHNGTTILEKIPHLNMISSFPSDPMHLLYLGVVKKITLIWCSSKVTQGKLSLREKGLISNRLSQLVHDIPSEFNRKPSSLLDSHRWKATECRQFILYLAPVVLKNIVSSDMYLNLISLHVAVTILCSPKLHRYIDQADTLLKYFIDTFIILYGADKMSHNFHSLYHLSSHSKQFGVLDQYSAFGFENYMRSILKLLRKSEKPLEQIVLRKIENDFSNVPVLLKSKIKSEPFYTNEHGLGPSLNFTNYLQYKKVTFSEFSLSVSIPNNCCILKNKSIVIIKNILIGNDNKFIVGRKFNKTIDFYTQPCLSSDLGIYAVHSIDLGPLQTWNLADIDNKCIKVSWKDDSFIVFPLIHSSENRDL